MLRPYDLIRIGELAKLGAEAVRGLNVMRDCRIHDAAERIEAAAHELMEIGREMTGELPETS